MNDSDEQNKEGEQKNGISSIVKKEEASNNRRRKKV